MMFVRTLSCRMGMHDPCKGPIEAHHAGVRGMGRKCHDDETVPLCKKHHLNFHSHNGPFKNFTKEAKKTWCERQISWTRDQWESAQDCDQVAW